MNNNWFPEDEYYEDDYYQERSQRSAQPLRSIRRSPRKDKVFSFGFTLLVFCYLMLLLGLFIQ